MTIRAGHHYDKKLVTKFASNFYELINASKTFPENNYQTQPENNKYRAICIIFIIIWIKFVTITAITFRKYD